MMRMRQAFVMAMVAGLVWVGVARGQTETHSNLQAVDNMGVSTWSGTYPFTIRGVLLHNPEDMLDFTWDPGAESEGRMGAQWQLFFQAVDPGDRGGTAMWMGQNYNSLGPWIPAGNFYTEEAWSNEMVRLNYDTNLMHHFRAGDLVEVTANKTLFYGGKLNINEAHRTDPTNDFFISLVTANYGLPTPERLTLSDLVSNGYDEIFDETRQTGGEHYQGMRVQLDSIRLATEGYGSDGWGKTEWADRLCTVTDGDGRFFTLRMPLTDLGSPPEGWFSAIGILNQESGSGNDGRMGYELFVQQVIPEAGTIGAIFVGFMGLWFWRWVRGTRLRDRTAS